MVIDDDHVRLGRFAPRLEQKTFLVRRASGALAEIRLGGYFIPYFRSRRDREVAQRSVARPFRPAANGLELVVQALIEERVPRRPRLIEAR
jgi:hypothetical protein